MSASRSRIHLLAAIPLLCALWAAPSALAQGPPELAAMQAGLDMAALPRDLVESPLAGMAAPGQFAAPVTSHAPRRVVPPTKPFHFAPQRPTVSPYLNLYRDERDDTLPNYFAFVLPQIRQQEFSHQQQLELARLQQQIQQAGGRPPAAWGGTVGGAAQPAGYQARFMNTGQYYTRPVLPLPADGGQ